MQRENYIFRSCLLLLSIAFCIVGSFISMISGEPADVLNRIGIIFQMIGILAVVPDLIGEKRLEEAITNVQGYKRTQHYIKEYLYGSQEIPTEELPLFLVILESIGNLTMTSILFFGAIALVPLVVQSDWIGKLLAISFGILGVESLIWIVLFFLFLIFRALVHRMPNLFDFFLALNSMMSVLGILISSGLAYSINIIIPLLIYIAQKPLRKMIAEVTLPFLLLGGVLQFIATYF